MDKQRLINEIEYLENKIINITKDYNEKINLKKQEIKEIKEQELSPYFINQNKYIKLYNNETKMKENKEHFGEYIVFRTGKDAGELYRTYPQENYDEDTYISHFGCSCHLNRLSCVTCNHYMSL